VRRLTRTTMSRAARRSLAIGVFLLSIPVISCGGAINATAAKDARPTTSHAIVVGRLSSLGCPDHRSLLDLAMGAGDARYVLLSKDGQSYQVEADDAGYFVAELAPGRYDLSAFHIQKNMGLSQWAPKGWFFQAPAGQVAYIGSIRLLCLGWESTGQVTQAQLVVGVVREYEAARSSFQRAFAGAGTPRDGSEHLATLAALPRTSGFEYELVLRGDQAEDSAPRELWAAIRGLARNPLPPGVQQTKNEMEYRLRFGAWEVLYLFDQPARWVVVTDVRKAGSATTHGRGGGSSP